MKKTTCGIIIKNEFNEILLGHATNNLHYDIPKGIKEYQEDEISAALRELNEEFGISFNKNDLTHIGKFSYNKRKNISLFIIFVNKNSIDIDKLYCSSWVFINGKKSFLEMDSYDWINYNEKEKYLSKVFLNLIKNNNIIEDTILS